MLGMGAIQAHASTISVNGLNGNQATITNSAGQVVSNTANLNEYDYYKVTYQWSIPDSETIESGDTAQFTLPANIRVRSSVTFNITDSDGQVVGKATIPAGSSTGTITFTNIPSSFRYDRHGTLSFYGEGKTQATTDINSWMIDKGGWVNDSSIGANGKPTQLYWNVVLNPVGKSLTNVTFTDQPQEGQQIVQSSIVAYQVVDNNGTYQLGAQLSPTITQNANGTETLSFGNIDYPVYIEYKTNLDPNSVSSTTNKWDNVGIVNWNNTSSQQATATIQYGGSGNEEGYNGSVELDKYAANTNQPLSGAVFNLENANGDVIKSGLTTNNDGQIIIANLADGTYQLVETKAPSGYQLNSTPIKFTINDATNQLHLAITDRNAPVASSSSQSSSK